MLFVIKLIALLAGLLCLVALADQLDLTKPLWNRLWPETILPRQPSPYERYQREIEDRRIVLRRQIANLEKGLTVSRQNRKELLCQVHNQVYPTSKFLDPNQLQREHPIAFALIRSIAASDQKLADDQNKLNRLRNDLVQLEARVIEARNELPLPEMELIGPSAAMELQDGSESAEKTYQQIIAEANNL